MKGTWIEAVILVEGKDIILSCYMSLSFDIFLLKMVILLLR